MSALDGFPGNENSEIVWHHFVKQYSEKMDTLLVDLQRTNNEVFKSLNAKFHFGLLNKDRCTRESCYNAVRKHMQGMGCGLMA